MIKLMTVCGASVLCALSLAPMAAAETGVNNSFDPAFQTIAGTLEQIDGNVYVVAEYITNYRGEEIKDKEMSVQVSSETKLVNGAKNVGDSVRIDVTSTGMANSIE